jgi:hypothetical protein
MNTEEFICIHCGMECKPTGVWQDSLVLVECKYCETRQWKPFNSNNQYITSSWGKEAREAYINKQLTKEVYDPTYYLKKEAW